MSFNNKVVIVTGASSGIGAAVAKKFSEEGAKVTIVGRNETKLNDVANTCEQGGNKPLILVADVTKDDDLKKIVSNTVDRFGKLDVLVNNAGIGGGVSLLSDLAMPMFDKVMNTNLRSAAYVTHLAVPHLIETKGNIVNVSSIASTCAISPRTAAYCASKAGLDHFMRVAALELAKYGVRVNCVNPGPVNTSIVENMGVDASAQAHLWDMFRNATLTGRISEPEEIADLILFLASDKAASITGSSYVIDNGAGLKGSWSTE